MSRPSLEDAYDKLVDVDFAMAAIGFIGETLQNIRNPKDAELAANCIQWVVNQARPLLSDASDAIEAHNGKARRAKA